MSKKDGGSAFPVSNGTGYIEGMTLRDFFAAKAMQAIIIGNQADIHVTDKAGSKGVARDAYVIADSMLEVREEGE